MRFLKNILKITVVLGLIWFLLTLWVQQPRMVGRQEFIPELEQGRVLLLYNPDPFYDLDRQLATAFADAMQGEGFYVILRGYAPSDSLDLSDFDLLGLFSNTYNWTPDRPTRRFLEQVDGLGGCSVVAVTLGSGDTDRSHRLLMEKLKARGAVILESGEYWLMRPNDESQQHLPNTAVARESARKLGIRVAKKLKAAAEKM